MYGAGRECRGVRGILGVGRKWWYSGARKGIGGIGTLGACRGVGPLGV